MDSTTVLCLILCLAIPQDCHAQHTHRGPPVITEQPGRAVYYIHEDRPELTLPCAAVGTPPLRYLWKKEGGISERQFSTSGSLTVSATGRYTCYAQNDFGTAVSMTTEVKEAELGRFEDDDEQTEFRVAATHPLVLPCGAPPGDPTPLVFWSRDDSYVLLTNGTAGSSWEGALGMALGEERSLVFVSARPGHTGRYQCEAMSPEMDSYKLLSVRKNVNVTGDVSDAPSRAPSILPGRNETTALRGHDAVLYCLAAGNPLPNVRWSKLADPSFAREGPVLQLPGVRSEQAGIYTCVASSVGQPDAIQTRTLTVEAAPYWTTPPSDVHVVPGGSDVISCEAGGEPPPRTRWMENGEPKPDYDNQTTVPVTVVNVKDVKVYQCQATNRNGQITANAILGIIEIGPKPTHVNSRVLRNSSVLISWRPIRHPNLIEFQVEFERVRGTSQPRMKQCGLDNPCQLNRLRYNTQFSYVVVAVYDGGEAPSRMKMFETRQTADDKAYDPIAAPRLWQTVMFAFGFVLVIGVATPVIMCVVLCIRDHINGVEMDELPTESDAWGRGRPKPKVTKDQIGAHVLQEEDDAHPRACDY